MNRFTGKIVLITGGTKGIGLATSRLFKQEGATVIACSRNKHALDADIQFYSLDISDPNSCKKCVDNVIAKYGKIDILVNNAGIMMDRTTKKMTDDEFQTVISTNINGTFNMTRIIGPIMQSKNYGSIINISSFVAKNGNIGQANYVASKAAIEGMTKCWAKEFAIHGENVRVNAIAPGVIITDIFKNTPENIIDSLKSKTILKRLGKEEEIAKAIVFLASDDSSYITGAIIPVDGGISLS